MEPRKRKLIFFVTVIFFALTLEVMAVGSVTWKSRLVIMGAWVVGWYQIYAYFYDEYMCPYQSTDSKLEKTPGLIVAVMLIAAAINMTFQWFEWGMK